MLKLLIIAGFALSAVAFLVLLLSFIGISTSGHREDRR